MNRLASALPSALVCVLLLVGINGHATPTGKKWFTLPVSYKVYPHSQVNGLPDFATRALPVVQRGFSHWMGGPGTGFTCTNWKVQYAGGFTTPVGRAAIALDGQNLVLWNSGENWAADSLTLAITHVSSRAATGEIVDADMEFNDNLRWKVGGTGTDNDVETIATHEAGHFLGLDHTQNRESVMFPTVQFGELKAALSPADVSDVCSVYPAPTTPTPPPLLGQGSPCTEDAQCQTALRCRGAAGAQERICTQECSTANPTCPTTLACLDASPAGTTGKACLVPPGTPNLCAFCTSGRDCSTGICAKSGALQWCSRACQTDAECGANYRCSADGLGSKLCVPAAGRCPGQCQTANDCAVGYACVGGTCEATGNAGDRCEVSEFCKDCLLCVGTKTAATCRPCCESVAADGLCKGCATKPCGAGEACTSVNTGKDKVCLESTGKPLCQACDSANLCQEGLACVNGACHAACNPKNPGACEACFPTGDGTTGVCACAGEIAFTGQPCGGTATGFLACAGRDLCVGAPGVCRTPCALGNDATCGTDEKCLSIGGTAVCIPNRTPGARCAPCDNGSCADGLTCVSGRCYQGCDVDNPSCSSCVGVGLGKGLCACDDERATEGGACGEILGKVVSCNPGLVCLNGTCRAGCDPQAPECPLASACEQQGRLGYVCVPPANAVASPGPGGGEGSGAPAGGPVIVEPTDFDAGCGCGANGGSGMSMLGLLALVAMAARRLER